MTATGLDVLDHSLHIAPSCTRSATGCRSTWRRISARSCR